METFPWARSKWCVCTSKVRPKWFICNTRVMSRSEQGELDVEATEERARALARQVWEGCVGSRITRLHRLIALRYDQALDQAGLTLPQVEILSALLMRGRPVGPSEMGKNLAVGRSAMSRKLAALEGRGWVQTAEHSGTGRSMTFVITAAGVEMLAHADQAWADVHEDTVGRLGVGAAAQLDMWLTDLQQLQAP